MSLLKKMLPDNWVEKSYLAAGAEFGDAVSYIFMGEGYDFKQLLKKWESWEEEYARRGYRTISLDRFVDLGGYGRPVSDLIYKKREEKEEPIFHSKIYREKFLGKVPKNVDLEKLLQDCKPQSGQYIPPSTEQ